ncbi:MAG: hypothetical protein K2I96_10020 [Lachnospiraceae bacterium]|nr:hypothetical protein [Lachnospiraceae bacterium]
MYSVNVDFRDEEIIKLYHRHGEMEQYHSKIKTNLGAEQLPTGKFKTNELMLELAYNILRMMGQASLQLDGIPMKMPVRRRRLRTVLEHIILPPAVVTKHARKTGVDLGRSNPYTSVSPRTASTFPQPHGIFHHFFPNPAQNRFSPRDRR